jgi:hypothetical protein
MALQAFYCWFDTGEFLILTIICRRQLTREGSDMPTGASRKKGMADRAPRFTIHVPIRYRVKDGKEWSQGQTKNISRSGILFCGDLALDKDTQVELGFVLPVEVSGEAAAEVVCRACICRTAPATDSETRPSVAAVILDYRIVRRHAA